MTTRNCGGGLTERLGQKEKESFCPNLSVSICEGIPFQDCYTAGLAVAGLAALCFFGLAGWLGAKEGREWLQLGKGALGLFITGSIIFMWGANVIIPIRPKR